jgi:PncC family amidohydrolase
MERALTKLHRLLIINARTVATAESCTGGLLSKLLTDIPGSSRYFVLGLVTYSNKAKEKLLSIPRALIAKKGAVSKEVALAMASAVRRRAGSDFGIGITGIAGPGGKTETRKVGTVFICINGKNRNICRKFIFRGNRLKVRKSAALEAMKLLKKLL